ncbi:hypothetical protein ACX8XN_14010 [Calditrichota bacterium GD2]
MFDSECYEFCCHFSSPAAVGDEKSIFVEGIGLFIAMRQAFKWRECALRGPLKNNMLSLNLFLKTVANFSSSALRRQASHGQAEIFMIYLILPKIFNKILIAQVALLAYILRCFSKQYG